MSKKLETCDSRLIINDLVVFIRELYFSRELIVQQRPNYWTSAEWVFIDTFIGSCFFMLMKLKWRSLYPVQYAKKVNLNQICSRSWRPTAKDNISRLNIVQAMSSFSLDY